VIADIAVIETLTADQRGFMVASYNFGDFGNLGNFGICLVGGNHSP
jgi:hypothetical protein